MADKKAYEETEVLPANLTSNHNVRGAREDGTGSFKMVWTKFITYLGTLFAKKPISLNVDAAIALLDNTIEGQEYIINGLTGTALPTGISKIRTFGIFSGTNVFDSNCEAFVTSIGRYVSCQYYDVATNKISCSYTLYAARITQIGGVVPTENSMLVNISGETPVYSVVSTGQIELTFTGSKLISADKTVPYLGVISLSGNTYVSCLGSDANKLMIETWKNNTLSDDYLNNTYIQVNVILNNN